MTSPREVIEGVQFQGVDERKRYTANISSCGSSPTNIVFTVKDSTGADVTRAVTALVISTRARASNVATIVTDEVHGLTTGNLVTIFDCAGTGYDAASVAVTVVNTTTFTYANAGANETTTAETAGRVETPTSATATAITTTLIQSPLILNLTTGSEEYQEYIAKIKFKIDGQTYTRFFLIIAEAT